MCLLPLLGLCANWQENVRPKLFAQLGPRDTQSFTGSLQVSSNNESGSETEDHFTTMLYTHMTEESLLVGARNILYKLSVDELRLKQTLTWMSLDLDRESCLVKGKDASECQNYVKVLQQYTDDPDRYMICGTNAYKPACRDYVDERGTFVLRDEQSGLGLAPFSPSHNSTAVLVGQHLFSGTVADFTGVDPIIFRKPLRTQQYDSTQLNSPDFVGSFEHEDFVYFFFREGAVEHINCGKSVFSRVARVCKNDKGGPNKSKYSWTSFLKARLNCSVPGDYPFYFDEIQAVSQLILGRYGTGPTENNVKPVDGDTVLYASFSTAPNSIGGSAICAFRLRDVSDAFSGSFKEHRDMSANWLAVPDHKVPNPRPGTCTNDTKGLPDVNLNFIKTHSLMDEPVAPFFGAPILIRTGLVSRFTVLAVDPQVGTTDGKLFDVIFVGTTTGRVIKAINAKAADSRNSVDTVVVEELQVFGRKTVIKDIKVMGGGVAGRRSLGRLAVMSTTEIRSTEVQRCDRAANCADCVALQDPYCAWDVRASRCSSGDWTSNMATSFLQSVVTGQHVQCPRADVAASSPASTSAATDDDAMYSYEHFYGRTSLGQVVNIVDSQNVDSNVDNSQGIGSGSADSPGGNGVQVVESSQVLFSLETLIITVSAGAVAALVVGFVTGYCCGRRCQKEDAAATLASHLGYPDTEYEYFEQRGGLARPTMLTGPGPGQGGPMVPMGGPCAPLLPSETSKIDSHHEEVTYAEPELVTGLAGYSGGPLLGGGGPIGPGVIGMSGPTGGVPPPNSRYVGSGGGGSGSTHYSSSLLMQQGGPSKFNTIHSSVNKRIGSGGNLGMMAMNHYDSNAVAANRIPGGNNGTYHMSTLGRTSSVRGPRDPLLPASSSAASSSGGSGGSGSNQASKVVDSAYGTTRSSKKVYL